MTLETLLRFLNWIPLGYIFETDLIPHLIETFLVMPIFRNITLKCLTEIVSINVGTYNDKFCVLFNLAMTKLKQVILFIFEYSIIQYIKKIFFLNRYYH